MATVSEIDGCFEALEQTMKFTGFERGEAMKFLFIARAVVTDINRCATALEEIADEQKKITAIQNAMLKGQGHTVQPRGH